MELLLLLEGSNNPDHNNLSSHAPLIDKIEISSITDKVCI